MLACCGLACGVTGAEGDVPIEIHGFTSLGYLVTTENEYISSESTEGTTELWEFALNGMWRPSDSVRVGAQVFARDFGDSDNGRIQLDWAFVEYRDRDAINGQLGRVKVPFGLYNEVLDVDAARVPVFLPDSVYKRKERDLYLSVDGAKIAGFFDADAAGSISYALYGGVKTIDEDSSTADSFRSFGLGDDLEIDSTPGIGGMLHWNTPLEGFGMRLSMAALKGFEMRGTTELSPSIQLTNNLQIDWFPACVASVVYEADDYTLASEYYRVFGDGEVASDVTGLGVVETTDFSDEAEGFYVSATWHALDRFDCYAALDYTSDGPGSWNDTDARRLSYVGAARYDLTEHWLVKGEVQYNDGTKGVISGADGADPVQRWWLFAVRTTVDF
ncbi:MAG: hypothetical protein PF961_02275 [Planctomycetota bacterium]|nr:hypothetical protein [Planctomycetota bacterium]